MFTRTIPRYVPLYAVVLFCLVLAPLCRAAGHGGDWDYRESHSDSRDFVSGGTLHLQLNVGDLEIRRSDSNQIRLRYTVKSRRESRLHDAHVNFEVNGRNASLDFHAPTGSNTSIDVELDIPQNTSLDIHAKVGDVRIEGIEGDKDVELGVGDIHIARDSSSYNLVRVSTSIGDVNGHLPQDRNSETSGWLGKTLRYSGNGKYELRAHVSVGDITLEGD